MRKHAFIVRECIEGTYQYSLIGTANSWETARRLTANYVKFNGWGELQEWLDESFHTQVTYTVNNIVNSADGGKKILFQIAAMPISNGNDNEFQLL